MRYQTLAGQAALIRRLGLVMDPQRFPPEFFQREDDTNDAEFYTMPRLVVHIDDGATTAVGRLFQQLIPENAEVLDLMSSWRTHWPEEHPRCPASTIFTDLASISFAGSPPRPGRVAGQRWSGSWGRQTPG